MDRLTSPPRSTATVLAIALGGFGLLRGQEKPAPAAPPAEVASEASPGPGAAAVERVKRLGFRMSARENPLATTAPEGAPAPGKAETEQTPSPGAMQLGRVPEAVALPPEVAALAKAGALAVADRDWTRARDLYLEMVKAAPGNALAYANLGVAEHQLGNLLAAAGNLTKSVELNPHIARNWQTLGVIHYERGDLALALSCLARSVHEAPGEAETRVILAAVARDFGWPDAAVTELQRAVEIDPKSANAHYNLAVTFLESAPPRIELARRHYFAAIDLGTTRSPEIEAILQAER